MLYCIDVKTSQVHVLGCPEITRKGKKKNENIIFLERFNNPNDAVIDSKLKGYSEANGCIHCCPSAHTE
ncbi:MAG: hypothetical protein WBG30_10385 [Psychrilyobacter sp.]|uniref:hypothetical protein n=1 Tax=Psychrilyobacter sp. TaxID=2586924 RepID=UPI003C738B8A